MTDYSGPYQAAPWAEAEWYRHMGPAMPSGVIGSAPGASSSGALALTLAGLSWTVGIGAANVAGSGFYRDAAAGDTITANTHSTQSRRDRLVLRRDLAAHTTSIARKQGTPATAPLAPTLTQDPTGVWEEALFSFLVPPNSGTSIGGIVDERSWIAPNLNLQTMNNRITAAEGGIAATNSAINTLTNRVDGLDDLGTKHTEGAAFTPSGGWAQGPGTTYVRDLGYGFASMYISLERTGGTIDGGASGNLGNIPLGTIRSGYQPVEPIPLSSGAGGPVTHGYLGADRIVYLAAVPSNYDITQDSEISLGATLYRRTG